MALFTRLPFNFSGSAYTPPSSSLPFDFQVDLTQYVIPDGWDSSAFTSPVVALYRLQALPPSADSLLFGTPTIADRKQTIYVVSYTRPTFGDVRAAISKTVTGVTVPFSEVVGTPDNVSITFYRPAVGNNLYFNFSSAYTAPTGLFIQFEQTALDVFRSVRAYGLDFGVVGDPDYPLKTAFVAYRIRSYTLPSIGDASGVGSNKIYNFILYAKPSGLETLNISYSTRIWNARQYVRTYGLNFGAVGDETNIAFKTQTVRLSGTGIFASTFGTTAFTNYYRYITPLNFSSLGAWTPLTSRISTLVVQDLAEDDVATTIAPLLATVPPTPFYVVQSSYTPTAKYIVYSVKLPTDVGYRQRYILSDAFNNFLQIGRPTVGYTLGVTVYGSDYAVLSAPTIDFVSIRPAGIDSLTIGAAADSTVLTSIYNNAQVAEVGSDEYLEFGRTHVINWWTFVTFYEDPDWFKEYNRGVGAFTSIRLRNQTIVTYGVNVSWVSFYSHIYNKAVLIYPYSVEPTASPTLWVAGNRVRYIYTQWAESDAYINPWHRAFNNGRALPVSGFDTFASPALTSVELYIRSIEARFIFSADLFGLTVTGYTPQSFEQYNARDFLTVSEPRISAVVQTLYPTGSDLNKVGFPILIGPFRLMLKPWWPYTSAVVNSALSVYNRNKEIRAGSFSTYESAVRPAWVSFYIRNLYAAGFLDSALPAPDIRDNRLYVTLISYGRSYLYVSINLTVRLADLTLPTVQFVSPPSISPPLDLEQRQIVSGPIYTEGVDSSVYGQPVVYNFGIRMERGILPRFYMDTHRYCTVIGVQYIHVKDLNPLIFDEDGNQIPPPNTGQWSNMLVMDKVNKPRVSPYTVYCTDDPEVCTQQAGENNPGKLFIPLYPLDDGMYQNQDIGGLKGWGYLPRAEVTLKNRTLKAYSLAGLPVFGVTRVAQTVQIVRVSGVNYLRFGYALEVWPYPQWLILDGIPSTIKIGTPSVWADRELLQYVYCKGLKESFGSTVVQKSIRNLYPAGIDSLTFSIRDYRWPMVHFPRRLYPSGLDPTTTGTAFAAYRIRSVLLEGFDSGTVESDEEFGHDFLSVRHANTPIIPAGLVEEFFGRSRVDNRYLYIRPYGVQGSRCLGHNTITH